MKKNYTEEDMLKVIQEVEAEFSTALAKAEAEVENKEVVTTSQENISGENFEQEVEGLYASMEKSEAEAHFKAISKVLGVSDMTKSEGNGEEVKLIKSELQTVKASNEAIAKENEELKKNLEKAIAIVTKVVKPAAPGRKAITSEMAFIAKSESEVVSAEKDVASLTKSEISSTLSAKIRSGKLEKKDKDAITNYYDGKAKIETIKHLL